MFDYNQLDQYQKYMLATASVFHNIYVPRFNSEGTLVKYITVPIVFAQNDKLYDIANSNTLINQYNNNIIETNYPVPSMALSIVGFSIDDNRKLSEINNFGENDEAFSPIPILLPMTLSIETKKLPDILKILEQIVPLFPNKQCKQINIYNKFNDEIKILLKSIDTNFPTDFGRNISDIFTADLMFDVFAKSFKIPKVAIEQAGYEFDIISIKANDESESILTNEET